MVERGPGHQTCAGEAGFISIDHGDQPRAYVGLDLAPCGVGCAPTAETDFGDSLADCRFGTLQHDAIDERNPLQCRTRQVAGTMPAVQADEGTAQRGVPVGHALALEVGQEQQVLRIARRGQQPMKCGADIAFGDSQQFGQPDHGVTAVLARAAELEQSIAEIDREQAVGLCRGSRQYAEHFSGAGEVVGEPIAECAKTNHRGPGISAHCHHGTSRKPGQRFGEAGCDASNHLGWRDRLRHDAWRDTEWRQQGYRGAQSGG